MESVGDSVYTAFSEDAEEQMVEKLQILEEASNVNGQLLELYRNDSVDQAYSFVLPYIEQTADYDALEGQLSATDRERLDYYFEQTVFVAWFQTMDEWTKLRAELEAWREKES